MMSRRDLTIRALMALIWVVLMIVLAAVGAICVGAFVFYDGRQFWSFCGALAVPWVMYLLSARMVDELDAIDAMQGWHRS